MTTSEAGRAKPIWAWESPEARKRRESVEENQLDPRYCQRGCGTKLRTGNREAGLCDRCREKEAESGAQRNAGGSASSRQYCKRGHDTREVGRTQSGGCAECVRKQQRARRKLGAPRKDRYCALPGLQAAKKARGYTWGQLARLSDIPATTLQSYAYRGARTSKERAKRIAGALGVSLRRLTKGDSS